jgi:hypothetical protein
VRLVPLLILLAIGGGVVGIRSLSDYARGSDELYYEAQTDELEGETAQAARRDWYTGPEARHAAINEDRPAHMVRVLDPAWVEYSAKFYRRRWVVPALAAAVDPVAGRERLRVVSMAGYLLIGPLLFLLLRMRFDVRTSLAVSAACILLPPLVQAGTGRGVDSWGLALELAALLFLVLQLDRGWVWFLPFVLAMAVLAFTRDNTLVPLSASVWLLWRQRHDVQVRLRNVALVAGGLVAALPAPLLFGTPLRDQLAYAIDEFAIPKDTSWGYILPHYPEAAARTVYYDLRYVTEHAFTPLVTPLLVLMLVLLAAALVTLLRRSPGDDPYFTVARGGFVGGLILLIVSVNYQAYRLELVWLPCVAIGAALWLSGVSRWVRTPERPRTRFHTRSHARLRAP